ncbi:MAG: ATP-binding protein [Deltaproteobacteria bacterium]|nr:ATP-binding protein [Deltaproteobacteria bacterium]
MPKIRARYLASQVVKDLKKKMVFVSGPRQVGKTTLSQSLIKKTGGEYLNWDNAAHRKQILKNQWPLEGLLVLDEIHKYRSWRNTLKGLYDVHKNAVKILVTGSARLDHYRRGGDSLQGRYHMLRLHPLSVAELKLKTTEQINTLINLSGFPEPYFSRSATGALRWSEEYRQRLIYDDVRDLEKIVDLAKLELLMFKIPELVGSTLSINSLREDLDVSHKAITHWLMILEKLCYIYRIPPFQSKKLRALKKEQKAYLYDWSLPENKGSRFENLVAGHLLKWVHYRQDVYGERYGLNYFRDVDKREVDFIITYRDKPVKAVECKLSDNNISPTLNYFKTKYPETDALQVCLQPKNEYANNLGVKLVSAVRFLSELI